MPPSRPRKAPHRPSSSAYVPPVGIWPISLTCSNLRGTPRRIHTPAPLLHTDPETSPRTERTCPRPVHARIATSSGQPHARTTTSCGLALTRAPSSRIVDGRSRTTSAPPPGRPPSPQSSARDTRIVPVERDRDGDVAATATDEERQPDGPTEQRRSPGHGRRGGDQDRQAQGHGQADCPHPLGTLRRQLRRRGHQGPQLRAPLDPPGRPSLRRDHLGDADRGHRQRVAASSSSSRRTSRSPTSGASSRRTSSSASTSAATSGRRSGRRASGS